MEPMPSASMPSTHVGIPVYLHEGQFSAYGTDHPIDRALGQARRVSSYSAAAKTGVSHSDVLQAASALHGSASQTVVAPRQIGAPSNQGGL